MTASLCALLGLLMERLGVPRLAAGSRCRAAHRAPLRVSRPFGLPSFPPFGRL